MLTQHTIFNSVGGQSRVPIKIPQLGEAKSIYLARTPKYSYEKIVDSLLDVAVEWSTGQFEEKFEGDYFTALCRLVCQLAQQSSLTSS